MSILLNRLLSNKTPLANPPLLLAEYTMGDLARMVYHQLTKTPDIAIKNYGRMETAVEEIVGDICLHLVRGDWNETRGMFSTFVYNYTNYKSMDRYKSNYIYNHTSHSIDRTTDLVATIPIETDTPDTSVDHVYKKIPKKYHWLLNKLQQGKSQKQIAREIGRTSSAVQQMVARIRTILQECAA